MKIHITPERSDGIAVLKIEGAFTVSAWNDLGTLVDVANELAEHSPPPSAVRMSLAGVDRIDSVGIGALMRIMFALKRSGTLLCLDNVCEDVQTQLAKAGVASLFKHVNVDWAVRSGVSRHL